MENSVRYVYFHDEKRFFGMKRVLSVLLVVALLVGVLGADMMAQAYANLQLVGDANGDGRVNNRDLSSLQQYISDWDVVVDEAAADANGDLVLNNQDLSLLQQMIHGEVRVKATAPITKYTSLGAPAEEYYSAAANRLARCAWDMTIYDGRLYVGCGDYNRNTGESPVLSCSLEDLGNWVEETIIPDEQVGRFVNINGVLTIPGYDPVGSAKYASYYECIDGEWVQHNNLPDGLHNFDVTWFQGRMYAAIGAADGNSPIAYTEDGETFLTLPLYKNGEPVVCISNSVVRSSNLYVLGDELYADFWYEEGENSRAAFEMYHYNAEEDRFDFVADLKSSTHGGMYSSAGLPLWEKAAVNDKMFLTTGYLYYTTDFAQYTQVTMPNDAIVYDMQAFGGRLYLLTAYQSGDKYKTVVYSTTAADPSDLRTEATLTYDLPPTAFVLNETNIFIGMGYWKDLGANGNGTILQMKR